MIFENKMNYKVKEIYKSIQGEGFHTGRVAILCRFAGCNLWSGNEKNRLLAKCNFYDTDFVGTNGINGGSYQDAKVLSNQIESIWGEDKRGRFVILTGGEQMLQVVNPLVNALHDKGFFIAIETNGTIRITQPIDWICVSPKVGAELVQKEGSELKLIYPQENIDPFIYETLNFDYFYLQPMDNSKLEHNMKISVEYCENNTLWRLSLQTHKFLGIK